MKLLFINQYYWPDSAATAQMLTDLCEFLASSAGGGHEVHVLCSRGKYDEGSQTHRTLLPRSETRGGVRIHRVRATGFGKRSVAAQALDFASFHLLVGLRTLLAGWRYDAIVTLTTPPLIGVYATAVRALSRARHVCWVMDLHPDVEFALGVLNPASLGPRLLDRLNTSHLRRADACVALGRCMRDRLAVKGVRAERIRTIALWGHADQGEPVPHEDNPFRAELALQGKLVVMYSGNAGMIHSFDEVCAAALALRDDPRFVFLFVGGGRRLQEVRELAERERLTSVRVLPYFPRERVRYSLAAGDVHLVTMRAGLEGLSVPSKLYGIMAAGRPAVFVGPGASETAHLIRELGCGRAVACGDSAGLVAALRELADNAALRERLGASARRAYEDTFNAASRGEAWRELLESLGRSTPRPPEARA